MKCWLEKDVYIHEYDINIMAHINFIIFDFHIHISVQKNLKLFSPKCQQIITD